MKPDAELIYMGKENVEGGELQKKINEIIVEKSREGLTVLRLKGGDPFVFGRGGEEIEALIAENIDFEVIPGISFGNCCSCLCWNTCYTQGDKYFLSCIYRAYEKRWN